MKDMLSLVIIVELEGSADSNTNVINDESRSFSDRETGK
jgi:hypothetical protein